MCRNGRLRITTMTRIPGFLLHNEFSVNCLAYFLGFSVLDSLSLLLLHLNELIVDGRVVRSFCLGCALGFKNGRGGVEVVGPCATRDAVRTGRMKNTTHPIFLTFIHK